MRAIVSLIYSLIKEVLTLFRGPCLPEFAPFEKGKTADTVSLNTNCEFLKCFDVMMQSASVECVVGTIRVMKARSHRRQLLHTYCRVYTNLVFLHVVGW